MKQLNLDEVLSSFEEDYPKEIEFIKRILDWDLENNYFSPDVQNPMKFYNFIRQLIDDRGI